MINLTVDNKEVTVEPNSTILEAASKVNVNIPTLCFSDDLTVYGGCRLCVVEVEGSDRLRPACNTRAREGMEVKTHSPRVREVRKTLFELIIASHDISCELNCLICNRQNSCQLKDVAEDIGISRMCLTPGADEERESDHSSHSVVREPNKCINCARCIRKCEEIQGVGVFAQASRGPETKVTTFKDRGMGNVECTNCGQCVVSCPTGALHEVYHMDQVWESLYDEQKHVIVQTAPSVRVALAESFGEEPGTIATGQMVAALRRLGFDRVFDTNFTADLTIMEEATEVVNRVTNNDNLPVLTSCSPGWIKYIEHFYPDYLQHLSSAKSPQQMFGAVAKTYYAENAGIDPEDLVVVSIMPCTAKKFEASRPEMNDDVDYVLTTREAARMLKSVGVDVCNLEPEKYDEMLGVSSGAGDIFGASGGVMEAAVRTAYNMITGVNLQEIEVTPVRGLEGLKSAEIPVTDDLTLKVGVAHGLNNAGIMMEKIKAGEEFHFVEMMACPGGCISGGGQPINTERSWREVREKRIAGLYDIDENKELRLSHENPKIQKLYEEFLQEPGSSKAHKLLHTEYVTRGVPGT